MIPVGPVGPVEIGAVAGRTATPVLVAQSRNHVRLALHAQRRGVPECQQSEQLPRESL